MRKRKFLLLVFSQNIFVCLVDFSPPHSKYYPQRNIFPMYSVYCMYRYFTYKYRHMNRLPLKFICINGWIMPHKIKGVLMCGRA